MTTTNPNQRAKKRYFVKGRVFAVVRSRNHQLDQIESMSQGEIAFAVIKSKPSKMGQIIDAGRDGLSFSYIDTRNGQPAVNELDILFAEKAFHLTRLPFEAVEDTRMTEKKPWSNHSMKRMNVAFGALSADQRRQLDHLIEHFTEGEVPDEKIEVA